MQSYFPDERIATVINDTWGIDLWLQLLSAVFRTLLPIRQLNQTEQVKVLLSVNSLLFTNTMLLKGPADRLLGYLNNNPMAALLYGQSVVTEIYGVLCLKLLGCLVATLKELYGVVNVDEWLSVSDIAFLMNKGGALAPTDDRFFELKIFYVFTGANVQSKFR